MNHANWNRKEYLWIKSSVRPIVESDPRKIMGSDFAWKMISFLERAHSLVEKGGGGCSWISITGCTGNMNLERVITRNHILRKTYESRESPMKNSLQC